MAKIYRQKKDVFTKHLYYFYSIIFLIFSLFSHSINQLSLKTHIFFNLFQNGQNPEIISFFSQNTESLLISLILL
jgi:hypothetical protein